MSEAKKTKVGRKPHLIKKKYIWIRVEPELKLTLEDKLGKKKLQTKIIDYLKTL